VRRLVLISCMLGSLLALGCGGGSTSPSTANVAIVDGVTGAAVGGAITGNTGDAVTVERSGYLRRDTLVPRNGTISLWPQTVDEAFVRAIVYSDAVGRGRLERWPTTTIQVTRDFPPAAIESVRLWVAFVPSDSAAITVTVDPNAPEWAQFPPDTIGFAVREIADSDAHIVSARLVFRSQADRADPPRFLHELGHALGLGHSARLQDLMFPSTARTTSTFSADERVLLTMMYTRRRSGQVPPDNDQALGTASTGRVRSIIP
jgi:hypothetical protein